MYQAGGEPIRQVARPSLQVAVAGVRARAQTGLVLRNLNQVTRIPKPYYLQCIHVMVT